jgi:hypothetical protein
MASQTDMVAAAQTAITLGNTMVTASQTLVDNAHAQMTATPPTITLDQYRDLVMHHAAIVGNAATIRQTAAVDLGSNIQTDTAALKQVTATLNGQLAGLKSVQNVVDKASKVLVAAGSLATLVATPSLMTATAVVSAVQAIFS